MASRQAERAALEPKDEEEGVKVEGDVDMENGDDDTKLHRGPSPSAASLNGYANGDTEHDELEDSPVLEDEFDDADGHDDASSSLSSGDDAHPRVEAAASRRQALKERADARTAEEALRIERRAKERQETKAGKHLAAERRRLAEEEAGVRERLRLLEAEFRSHLFTLRSRPLGIDRFGNKVWWLDGLGSAPLNLYSEGRAYYGTGRVYLQGGDEVELGFSREAAELSVDELDARRTSEEGPVRLGPTEWAMYDTPESVRLGRRGTSPALTS